MNHCFEIGHYQQNVPQHYYLLDTLVYLFIYLFIYLFHHSVRKKGSVIIIIRFSVLLRFTISKFQDSYLVSRIQVHLGWTRFFQTWQGEHCSVVPPVALLSRVLNFMSHSRAHDTLVLPFWPFAPFWPLLVDLARTFWELVADYHFLDGALTVRQGRNTSSPLASPHVAWSYHCRETCLFIVFSLSPVVVFT